MMETAHVTRLRDQRAGALRLITDTRDRIEAAAAMDGLVPDATREMLLTVNEAVERLETWCPVLFGVSVGTEEACCCWRCTYAEPPSDPFEE